MSQRRACGERRDYLMQDRINDRPVGTEYTRKLEYLAVVGFERNYIEGSRRRAKSNYNKLPGGEIESGGQLTAVSKQT